MSFFYQNRKEQLYLYLSNNNPYAVHLHRQLELIYVLSGSTTVTVEQQEFPLTPGQVHCTRCGAPISFGTLCAKCMRQKDVSVHSSAREDVSDSRMRFIED